MRKYKVGIIGATGMVGQRFALLLENHPWFEVTALAASARSAGKPYGEVVDGRWHMTAALPEKYKDMVILDADNVEEVASKVDFCFCAVNMKKDEIRALEERYAKAECPIVSNNSAHRFTPDVPMVIPEINADHIKVIEAQRKRLGTKRGFVAVKSNCSLQSYVPAIHPLKALGVDKVLACTYQAISGAGKTFKTWPEMVDNLIRISAARRRSPRRSRSKSGVTLRETRLFSPTTSPSPLSVCACPFPTVTPRRCSCPLRKASKSPALKKSSRFGRIIRAEHRSSIFPAHPSSSSTTLPSLTVRRFIPREISRTAWRFPSADSEKIRSTTTNSSACPTTH